MGAYVRCVGHAQPVNNMGREARLVKKRSARSLTELLDAAPVTPEWRKAEGYYKMADGSLRRIIAKTPSRKARKNQERNAARA